MALNEFEVDLLFPSIWEVYPNKDKEFAARKALRLLFKTDRDVDPKKLLQTVKIYALESEGDEFTYRLDNFLRNDHWKDIYEQFDNLDGYLSSLEQTRKDAVNVITQWNKSRKSHWCECIDTESKIGMVKDALANNFFKENWQRALWLLTKIFAHTFHENDSRSKIIISIRWFCKVSSDSHTVSRIIEGEFGKAYEEKSYKTFQFKEFTQEQIEENKRMFNEVFKRKVTIDDDEI